MTAPTYLITGATGETGRYTVDELLGRGESVRALVYKEDERAERLQALGAEVVVGDLLNLDDVRNALSGIAAAYFVYPIRPGLIQATAYFAQAAKELGVGAIVNMSQISSRSDSKSHAAQDHWIGERVFDWSGVPVTHLRPTFFAQWLLYPHFRASIRDHGVIAQPFGNGRHAPIAAEDQARLIAQILKEPAPHRGKTYKLHGPVEMSQTEIAAVVSDVLGKKVTYQPIEVAQYRERLEATPGFPEFLTQHLCEVAIDYQNGLFAGTNNVVEEITGRPAMTVQAFVASHRNAFQPALPH